MTVRRVRLGLAGALLAAGTAGCSGSGPGQGQGPTTLPAGTCPGPGTGGAAIDYVDFVVHAGRMYTSTTTGPADAVPEAKVGPLVRTVSCRIADTRVSPEFRYRDGDASYLAAGTELHRVAGYRETFRLTARDEGGAWRLFEVSTDDSARTGADLLDLSPGVTAIRLVDPETDAATASLEDAARIRTLVAAVLAARAVPEPSTRTAVGDERPANLRFELADGTAVDRVWYRRAGYLGFQIVAPPELAAAFPA